MRRQTYYNKGKWQTVMRIADYSPDVDPNSALGFSNGHSLYNGYPYIMFYPSNWGFWDIYIKNSLCINSSSSGSYHSGVDNFATGWKSGEKHSVKIVTSPKLTADNKFFNNGGAGRMTVWLDGVQKFEVDTWLCNTNFPGKIWTSDFSQHSSYPSADVILSNISYKDNAKVLIIMSWVCLKSTKIVVLKLLSIFNFSI